MFRSGRKIESGTARYVTKVETAALWLEVAYRGGEEQAGRDNPQQTHVVARCLKKADVHWPLSPWLELWTREFGNPAMPGGAWNGIKLCEIHSGRAFLAIATELLEVDIGTGKQAWKVKTGNTPIAWITGSPNRDLLIVFNEYYGFEHPEGLGNIAAYDLNGNEVWRVRPPAEDDIFSNAPYYRNGILKAASWSGLLCSLDEQTGSIIHREFTK